ncbi:MAG UNVERIFIED_CONTAM: protein kinase [Planctomycetaceae bacterium]|jgi:serine/threonine protein kinase
MNQQQRSIEETILMKRPPDVAWKPPKGEVIRGTDFRIRIGPTIYSGSRIVCRGIDEKCSDPEKKSLILIFRKDVVERGCSDSRFVIDLTKIDLKKYGADHWPYPYVELIRRNSVVQLTVTPDAGDGVFKIVDFLGMGGFGEVWEAEALDQTDGVIPARRAIKFLEPWESKNSNRLEAEGNSALSRLQKLRGMEQFTIGFYGDFILPDKAQNPGWPSCGIVMELAGATLEDVVQYYLSDNTGKVRLQQPTMLHLCGQLIDAVSSLHRLGYVHCDLKERNVLLVFPSCKWRDPAAPGGTDPLLKARVVLGDFDTLTPIGETHRKILQQTLEGHRAPELMQTAGANSQANSSGGHESVASRRLLCTWSDLRKAEAVYGRQSGVARACRGAVAGQGSRCSSETWQPL